MFLWPDRAQDTALSPCELVPKAVFFAERPVLKTQQINVFVIDNHTVVTVRKNSSEEEKAGIWHEVIVQLEVRLALLCSCSCIPRPDQQSR